MEMKVGYNIKRLRTARKITQEQLSVAMNVTSAAVSKWERGETHPDITLLRPLACFFGVTIDELIGYNPKEIQSEIDKIIAFYRQHPNDDKGRELITEAYRNYPNDYWIMYYYMLNITGNFTNANTKSILLHKEELNRICDKIIEGCKDETLLLGAWYMKSRIFSAEGKDIESFRILVQHFALEGNSLELLHNDLFSKTTSEYCFCLQKYTYKSAGCAGDGLGRMIFYDSTLSMVEKADRTIKIAEALIDSFQKTGEVFFLVQASDLIGVVETLLCSAFDGGTDEQIISLMDMSLYAKKQLEEIKKAGKVLSLGLHDLSFNLFERVLDFHVNAKDSRLAQLLKNPKYKAVLDKYMK